MYSVLQDSKAISSLILLLCSTVKAQITLPTLTGCIGNPTGTATYSTQMTVETGTERIIAGDFWSQLGAVWVLSSDTEGVEFGKPGIPGFGAGFGGGGPPAAAQSALKLDPSKTAWTLSVPTSSLGGEWDIVFAASATGQIHQTISGQVPCLGAVASATVSGNPAIASSCVNNQISTEAAVWSTYGVQTYMSSLLQAAAPAPTDPQVNGASLLHDDVNPAGAMCTYTAQCAGVSCNGVKDNESGSIESIHRYLAWNAVANLNNYLYSLHEALFDAGTLSGLLNGRIVTTFFTKPTPDATWQQILNVFTPLLGVFSAMLGPFSAAGGAILGVIGGVASSISAGGTLADLAPVVDQRFTEFATIEAFVGHYLNATVAGIESAYNSILGADTSAVIWASSTLGNTDLEKNGYFGLGNWVDSNYTEGLTDDLYSSLSKIFTYKAVNFAWVDSGVFVMYVPYGKPIADVKGNVQEAGVDASFCQNELSDNDNIGTLTICDAPGPGMARIFNAGTASGNGDLLETSPMGWDSGEAGITVDGAIRGSISSFFAGDFGYDASNPYKDTLSAGKGLSSEQVDSLSKLEITEETAGLFNIPVCQIFDLRFFPPASGNSCSACQSSVGGTAGSTKKFGDNINDIVKDVLSGPPNQISCGGYYGNSCSRQCPESKYDGTSF